jgi:hypothetical protein
LRALRRGLPTMVAVLTRSRTASRGRREHSAARRISLAFSPILVFAFLTSSIGVATPMRNCEPQIGCWDISQSGINSDQRAGDRGIRIDPLQLKDDASLVTLSTPEGKYIVSAADGHRVAPMRRAGFRSVFLEIDAFHRNRRNPVRRGRSRHEAEQFAAPGLLRRVLATIRALGGATFCAQATGSAAMSLKGSARRHF